MKVVRVNRLPTCDICSDTQAAFDVPTNRRAWAYLCVDCYPTHAAPHAGTVGSKLSLRNPVRTWEEERFAGWMKLVDAELTKICGLSSMDLPDIAYADLYQGGLGTLEAAHLALDEAGYPADQL